MDQERPNVKSSALSIATPGATWKTDAVSPATRTRAQARVAQIELIKVVARRLISEKGVAGLSLREVAREMGVVSSALYRYFASRDELLTALIVDAYNSLGAAVERADARHAGASPRVRWHAAARSLRRWALGHPHEYALIYGTPVPNYVAPDDTIGAATRVVRVLGKIYSDDWDQRPARRSKSARANDSSNYLEVAALSDVLLHVPPEQYVRALMAWTQLFGAVNFELFGHYKGSVRNASAMYERVVEELALSLDLTP